MKEPDYVPVFPRNQAQMIYSMGWKLTDVTRQDWYDAEKVALAALWNLEYMDYDVAFGCYYDMGFGILALGGLLDIPEKFGMSVQCKEFPVKTKDDWAKVKKQLFAQFFKRIKKRDKREVRKWQRMQLQW